MAVVFDLLRAIYIYSRILIPDLKNGTSWGTLWFQIGEYERVKSWRKGFDPTCCQRHIKIAISKWRSSSIAATPSGNPLLLTQFDLTDTHKIVFPLANISIIGPIPRTCTHEIYYVHWFSGDVSRAPRTEIFPKWHTMFVCIYACNLWDLQRSYKEYFVDTDSEDDPTLSEWFPAEDIRRQSGDLMNLGLNREVTAVGRWWPRDTRCLAACVRCFQVRKRIRVDVPNKSALLWMSSLSQFVGNICAANLIILLVKDTYKY